MNAFVLSLYQNPMFYIGLLFAFLAALAAMFFLGGFFAGIPHFFDLSSNEHHHEYYRHIVTWGALCLIYLFIYWELLRATIGFFTNGPADNFWGFAWLAFLWIVFVVLPFVL